jgi:hypothetical protein
MQNIKKIYLYVVSLVSLIILVIGSIMLINMALKAWVFTKADNNYYGSYAKPTAEYCKTLAPDGKVPLECQPGYEEEQRKQEAENRSSQRQRDAAQAVSMIIVAAPVFYFHWRLARKEV